jgi:citrate lyase beta subunit
MEYLKLGASLYVPAIHPDIIGIAKGLKYPNLKSVIIDTEDSITSDDLPFAYHHINKMLQALEPETRKRPLVFIRTRNPKEFERLSRFEKIENIDGFALPKFTVENMDEYMSTDIPGKLYMPILEKDIFSLRSLEKIRDFLLPYREKIITLRIGATDLLGSLNLRRESHTTIYEVGLMNQLIANIVTTFKPFGFNISGAVWESFSEDTRGKLQQEVKLDLLNGLFGKSIIHPWQIDVVQDMYKVNSDDYEIAMKLLEPYSPAVFKGHNRMNEKATHAGWAKNIVEMAEIYGVRKD